MNSRGQDKQAGQPTLRRLLAIQAILVILSVDSWATPDKEGCRVQCSVEFCAVALHKTSLNRTAWSALSLST